MNPTYQVRPPYRPIQYGGLAPTSGTGFDLTPGMNGLKVQLVADYLGVDEGAHQSMSPALIAAVAAFQAERNLPADGVVNRRTWNALGFADDDWTALDGYQAPLRVTPAMTRAEIVEQFVAAALDYEGARYIWGGANHPNEGADCSGLVLQALYSVGIDPAPITPVAHALSDWRSSREFYALPDLLHVPISDVQRGDIVFYAIKGGLIDHVAVALGGGKIVELVGTGGRTRGLTDPPGLQPEAVRPLP